MALKTLPMETVGASAGARGERGRFPLAAWASRRPSTRAPHGLGLGVWALALLLALPLLPALTGLIALALDGGLWAHLWSTILPERLWNTLVLAVGVGLGTLALGTGLAWLVTAYRFPGRGLFAWALFLPLAVPSYVLGYVYMATLDAAGPLQRALGTGWNVRTGLWAVIVLTLALYPYVYGLARAAFRELPRGAWEAARLLGGSKWAAFRRVALPLARPSLAAGTALAVMEALTDFAVVGFFNFPTLSEGIVRVWRGMMAREAALGLAGLLLLVALGGLWAERRLRGRRGFAQSRGRAPGLEPQALSGLRAWGATALPALVLLAAFGLPLVQLGVWAWDELTRGVVDWAWLGALARHSLTLALLAAGLTTGLAVALAAAAPTGVGAWAVRLATLGYAVPGSVVAVGALALLARLDHGLNAVAERALGVPVGLVFTGTLLGLLYAYVVRFLAVAYGGVGASFAKLKPSIVDAARTVAPPRRVLLKVQLPLIAPGALAALLLVLVDALKELPIALLLRPFGFDTLAVWIYQMAAESMWAGTALPSLLLISVGLGPVIVLSRLDLFGREASTPHER